MSSPSFVQRLEHNFSQLVITLGYRCNMFCKHCFIGDKLHDHKTIISYENGIKLIESAAKLKTIKTVAFVGGEPFVYYKMMLKLADYLFKHYRCPLNVTTNASWSKTPEMTKKLLDPLFERGLIYLMISLDNYHLEFGKMEHVANCINRCHELGITLSVQIIDRVGAKTKNDFCKELELFEVDTSTINWIETSCSAIGNAETLLSKEALKWYDEIPEGGCNAGEILNIQPDGEIKPCCGAGLMAKRLSIGNARTDDVDDCVKQAEADPLINSLIARQGPRGLAQVLIQAGRQDLLMKHSPFTDACHACHSFLTDAETLAVIEKGLEGKNIEMLLERILATKQSEILDIVNN